MGPKKQNESPIPEMNEIFEGMQDLLIDEDGNPLTPDHPQYNKLTGLMKLMAEHIESQPEGNPPKNQPGQA